MKSCLFDLVLRQQIPSNVVNEEKCHSQGNNILQRVSQEIQTCVNKKKQVDINRKYNNNRQTIEHSATRDRYI